MKDFKLFLPNKLILEKNFYGYHFSRKGKRIKIFPVIVKPLVEVRYTAKEIKLFEK